VRTGRMARNKNAALLGTVTYRMPIDPRQRLSNILDLFALGDSQLQTVIDESLYTWARAKTASR
jgi:hypothetical protein